MEAVIARGLRDHRTALELLEAYRTAQVIPVLLGFPNEKLFTTNDLLEDIFRHTLLDWPRRISVRNNDENSRKVIGYVHAPLQVFEGMTQEQDFVCGHRVDRKGEHILIQHRRGYRGH